MGEELNFGPYVSPQDQQTLDQYNSLSYIDRFKRRYNIAKQFLSTPSIPNVINAFGAIMGDYDPKDPRKLSGTPILLPDNFGSSIKAFGQLGFAKQLENSINKYKESKLPKFNIQPTISKVFSQPTPKGMVKGNEVKVQPSVVDDILENGLTIRKAVPVKISNPITNSAEAQAARDFLAEPYWKEIMDYGITPFTKSKKAYQTPWNPVSKSVNKVSTTGQTKTVINPKSSNKKYSSEIERKNAQNKRSKEYYRTKVEDKRNGVKFSERKQNNIEQFFQTGKLSHTNRGYGRVDRARDQYDLERMENYPEFAKDVRRLKLRLAKLQDKESPDKAAIKQVKQEIKDLMWAFRQKTGK